MLPETILPKLTWATSKRNMTNSVEVVGLLALEKLEKTVDSHQHSGWTI